MIRYVVAHEVGHTIGLRHNHRASQAYSIEELRDPEFVKKNGNVASIMSYGRYNYVAQPEDKIPVADLIPKLAPYDYFAIEWGYTPFENEEKEDEELAKLTAKQLEDPKLRFGNPNPMEDPSQQTEDLGSDSVLATELGLKNLERVAEYLVEATSNEGENYDQLRNMYDQLVGQLRREMGHVANVVGGVVRTNSYYGDADVQYEPVSPEKQKAAVALINEHAFTVPEFLTRSDILLRLEADGAADRILGMQRSLLGSLMNESRLKRMAENASRSEEDDEAYWPIDLIHDLTDGIFDEIAGDDPEPIDLYRRNLQRAYLDMLIEQVKADSPSSDLPALARYELKRIADLLNSGLAPAVIREDPMTASHLEDLQARLSQALEPRSAENGD